MSSLIRQEVRELTWIFLWTAGYTRSTGKIVNCWSKRKKRRARKDQKRTTRKLWNGKSLARKSQKFLRWTVSQIQLSNLTIYNTELTMENIPLNIHNMYISYIVKKTNFSVILKQLLHITNLHRKKFFI